MLFGAIGMGSNPRRHACAHPPDACMSASNESQLIDRIWLVDGMLDDKYLHNTDT